MNNTRDKESRKKAPLTAPMVPYKVWQAGRRAPKAPERGSPLGGRRVGRRGD